MDKVTKLKGIARDLSASNRNVLATDLIKTNKRSASSTKGWSTRRFNLTKKATEINSTNNQPSALDNARVLIRTSGHISRPRTILTGYVARSLIHKVKRMFPGGASNEPKSFS